MRSLFVIICLFFVTFAVQAQRLHSTEVALEKVQPTTVEKNVELIAIPMLGDIAISKLTDDLREALMAFRVDAPHIADSIAYVELDKTAQMQHKKVVERNQPKLIQTEE